MSISGCFVFMDNLINNFELWVRMGSNSFLFLTPILSFLAKIKNTGFYQMQAKTFYLISPLNQ